MLPSFDPHAPGGSTPPPAPGPQGAGPLRAADDGTLDVDGLVAQLYAELRVLARAQRQRHGAAETLNTTAVVHEAYEKLSAYDAAWADRRHFFRTAARVMRQIMVDYARRRHADKRGGPSADVPFDDRWMVPAAGEMDLDALDEALTRLAELDARQAAVVEMRYFVGLTIEETADVLGLAPATVKRAWTVARAWLYDALTTP